MIKRIEQKLQEEDILMIKKCMKKENCIEIQIKMTMTWHNTLSVVDKICMTSFTKAWRGGGALSFHS